MTTDVTDLPPINFEELAENRLISQYKGSVQLKKLINIAAEQIISLQNVNQDLLNLRQLDVAVGAQLDIIGAIVGQERFLIESDLIVFFGFSDVPGYKGFYDIEGGVWENSETDGLIPISDDDYRRYIYAKIFKNQSRFTLTEIEELAQVVMNDPGASATEPQPLLTMVCFSRPLTSSEIAILESVGTGDTNKQLIPPPSGCNIMYCYYDGTPFGFSDVPGNHVGFYDVEGGVWSTIIMPMP